MESPEIDIHTCTQICWLWQHNSFSKVWSFKQMRMEQLDVYIPLRKKNLWSIPQAIHKSQPKIVIGLNVSNKAIPNLEEYMRKMFHDLEISYI